MDVETVQRALDKPALDLIRDGLGRADKTGERLGKAQRRLAQSQPLVAG